MMMHGRLNVVLATLAKNQIKTRETATPILAGPTEIATMEKAIATTPCAAQNPGRTDIARARLRSARRPAV
jgi:hypothetical protein